MFHSITVAGPPKWDRVAAESRRYPSDSIIDLTQPPYNADQTGHRDATTAIQKAINDHAHKSRILFLPDGTYRLTDTLGFPAKDNDPNGAPRAFLSIVGESRDGVTLKLDDRLKKFSDAKTPRPVLRTTADRWSNDQFMIFLEKLTINTGQGNPGAIGVTWIVNNCGAMRDVMIRSGDPAHIGVAGIDMATRTIPGPALIHRVTVEGFDYGIHIENPQYNTVIEHLRLTDQRKAGILNRQHILTVRSLLADTTVPAVVNDHVDGLLTLIDSENTAGPIVLNKGRMFVRNVKGKPGTAKERVVGGTLRLFPGKRLSLNLPIKETPEVPWDDPSTWVNVADFGAKPDDWGDDAPAVQRAIDSMKGPEKTLYFPPGRWVFRSSITIRGNVRRIFGGNAQWHRANELLTANEPVMRLEDTASGLLVIENVFITNGAPGKPYRSWFFENHRTQPVVFRDISCWGGTFYIGAGDPSEVDREVFFENVEANRGMGMENVIAGAVLQFNPGEKVWARQLNCEQPILGIRNYGADLWVLGLKTENRGTMIDTRGGGRTEILGAMTHDTWKEEDVRRPMLIVDNASMSFVGAQPNNRNGRPDWRWLVRETREQVTRDLHAKEKRVPKQTGDEAYVLPLFVGVAE